MQIRLPAASDVATAVDAWSAADTRLSMLLARYGDAAPSLRHYGLILWESGQLQAASQALIGAAALAPKDARVWSDLSGVFNALGHQTEAAACATESLAHDATQAQMWMRLGSIEAARDRMAESVTAYTQAVAKDASLVDAWVGLGLARYAQKQFAEAIDAFRQAIRRGKGDDPAIQGCFGQSLYAVGDFAGAAEALSLACERQPGNAALRLRQTRAQFAVDAINGSAEDALVICARQNLSAADLEKTLSDAFHLLSAHGHLAAAIRVGALRLARQPDDSIQAYLLATLKGEQMARAPDAYIVSFFDRFADEFDQKLVDVLGYQVPGDLVDMAKSVAEATGRAIANVLDLGCGTGLVGARMAPLPRNLTGVDLSERMLDKARQLGVYATLVGAEIQSFLDSDTGRYDLVVAADVLIYFGDLSSIFEGVARAYWHPVAFLPSRSKRRRRATSPICRRGASRTVRPMSNDCRTASASRFSTVARRPSEWTRRGERRAY